MTIDEARNRLIGLIRPIKVKLFDTEVKVKQEEYYPETKPIIEAIEYAIAGLEELKGYRSQDLIPRDKAYSILLHNGKEHYLNNGMHNDEVTNIIDKMIAEIEQIPKAEPPQFKEERSCDNCEWKGTDCWNAPEGEKVNDCTQWRRKVERNGDCETCKHYEMGDGYCRDCGATINHYEPYIPKEKI